MISLKFLYNNPLGKLFTNDKISKNSVVILAETDPDLDSDQQRAQYVRSIPKALLFKNLLLQGYLVNPKFLKKIDNFQIKSDDLWLATYPKSGTTWTEEIISLIYNNGDIDKVKDKLLATRVVHFEVGPPLGHSRWLKKLKSPRLLATHLPVTHIPSQLKQSKCKIIYVMRNPKDNAVSYYHHHRISTYLGNYRGPWNTFVDLFANGHLAHGDWFEHIKGYRQLSIQYPNRVLFISYEELKTDLPKMIELIANFVERKLSQEVIDRIAKHCSFDEMKTNNMVNREKIPIKDLFDMTESKFMRKGIIGDWKTHFSTQQSKQFDDKYNDKLNELGLTVCYDSEDAYHRMQTNGRIINKNFQSFDDNQNITDNSDSGYDISL
ncbi:sulfotransferase 1B1-like [Oppia nitens]|uniref:sulfotransferase 1B1-like n=1 Tax=Oppia nitens TaxID=1686743 RepID=UPI0023DB0C7D|nr:sulfotransferase 1B1-like [Oppia nitens]